MQVVQSVALIWVLLDLTFVLLLIRRARVPVVIVVASQMLFALFLAAGLVGSDRLSTLMYWAALGTANVSLAAVGFAHQRALAIGGLAGTAAATTLYFLGSFASLALLVAAGVLCIGSAFFPHRAPSPGS